MCIRNKAFREMVQGMIESRRRGSSEEEGSGVGVGVGGGENWLIKDYEAWVVSRSTTSSTDSSSPESSTLTVAQAVKRGVASHKKESEWLDSKETKRAFLTPSAVTLKRRVQPVGEEKGKVYDAESWAGDEEEEQKREEAEWEEVVSYAAEEGVDGGLGGGEGEGGEGREVGGAGGKREVEERWEEEGEEVDVEGAVGRMLERADEEDEEGWEREMGVEEKGKEGEGEVKKD